jgi:hypothetical protein
MSSGPNRILTGRHEADENKKGSVVSIAACGVRRAEVKNLHVPHLLHVFMSKSENVPALLSRDFAIGFPAL